MRPLRFASPSPIGSLFLVASYLRIEDRELEVGGPN
jgi:hypothetical protein